MKSTYSKAPLVEWAEQNPRRETEAEHFALIEAAYAQAICARINLSFR